MPSCIRKTVLAFRITKAVMTRIIFGLHGVVCVWRVVVTKGQYWYWGLVSSLVLLIAEGVFTLKKKKGGEWKWFCPSVFLYLASTLPAIWFLELDLLDRRIGNRDFVLTGQKTNFQREDTSLLLGKIFFNLPLEDWVKILEQVLLLVLIVGRWLLPKGPITREQLSQLLLVYIGMAADIIELFEAFKEEEVKYNLQLTIIILALWTASLLQFCFVMSAAKARKSRPSFTKQPSRRSLANSQGCFTCRSEILSIMTTIILQDGSFLVLRMTLIFRYNVVSYTNIFFTAKNTLVNVLQLYRLVVLYAESFKLIKRQKSEPTFDEIFLAKAGILINQMAAKEEERRRLRAFNLIDVQTQFPEPDLTGAEETHVLTGTGGIEEDENINAVVIENPMNSLGNGDVNPMPVIQEKQSSSLPNSKISRGKRMKAKLQTLGPEIMKMTMVYLNPAVDSSDSILGDFTGKCSPRKDPVCPSYQDGESMALQEIKGSGETTDEAAKVTMHKKTSKGDKSVNKFKGVVHDVIHTERGRRRNSNQSHCDSNLAGNNIEVIADVNMPSIHDNEVRRVFDESPPSSLTVDCLEDVVTLENETVMEYLHLPSTQSKTTRMSVTKEDASEKSRSGRKSKWRWRKAKTVQINKKSSDVNQNSDEDVHFDNEMLTSGSDQA